MKAIVFAAALVAATVAVSAASTPAFAQVQGSFGTMKVTYNAKTNRYCFRETRPSTPVAATQCGSKEMWAREGLTITRTRSVQLARR